MAKILTYNVNGIRAAMNKGFTQWLQNENPDIVCLQETKAMREQVESQVFEYLGYKQFWFSAEKKGYSGVAIFTKEEPLHVEFGCGNELYDREGRVLRADYNGYSVISVYHPSGSSGEERQEFKMKWLDFFFDYIENLKKKIPNLIICGDYNICHQAIDIHDPVSNKDSSGFLPEERAWMSKFIGSGFIDSFRKFNPNPHEYTWWSYRAAARERNKGWRIDYIMVANPLNERLINSKILQQVHHSDHCPMFIEIQ